ncbi:hypothetical protein [Arthrobacter sp. MA-N2]|uniref:hypothetical protein n=1 Tax=Arthrobacter sp. MA-N2 TaxID=1101188 RepID=UPI0004829580|nr:hypothetical protein [Arthrobacter sp. MA-N2]
MNRKEGKARWTYTCEPCEVRLTHPDQFRAIEACHRHERGFGHIVALLGSGLTATFAPIIAAFGSGYASKAAVERESAAVAAKYAPLPEAKSALDALEAMSFAQIPLPPNTPRDPTLRRDRRKWGGR